MPKSHGRVELAIISIYAMMNSSAKIHTRIYSNLNAQGMLNAIQ